MDSLHSVEVHDGPDEHGALFVGAVRGLVGEREGEHSTFACFEAWLVEDFIEYLIYVF